MSGRLWKPGDPLDGPVPDLEAEQAARDLERAEADAEAAGVSARARATLLGAARALDALADDGTSSDAIRSLLEAGTEPGEPALDARQLRDVEKLGARLSKAAARARKLRLRQAGP